MKSTSLTVSIVIFLPTNLLAFTLNDISLRQSSVVSTRLSLYRSAQEAITEAERICAMEGPNSERCKVAWDIVEELKAADSHDRKKPAPVELNYSPLLHGFDLLSNKIDRDLDELKNLSMQLVEVGAGSEVERLVYASDEMKQILEEARIALDQYR
jgi:hypothetical protein